MKMRDLTEKNHHEQELTEEGLSKVTGGGISNGVSNLITKQQFGKSAAAVLGAGLTEFLVPNPGQKPFWEHQQSKKDTTSATTF
jgi:hypothetical protein